MTKKECVDKALSLFDEGYACAQSVLLAFAEQFDLDLETAKLISSTFGGGMGRLREKCGAVTGGFMVIGLAFGNSDPKDMETKLAAYKKVRELDEAIKQIHGTTNCNELLKKHVTEVEIEKRKHHKVICRKVVADAVGTVYDFINSGNMQIVQ